VAAETFGWSQPRDEQLQAMEQVMPGHDVLAALPLVLVSRPGAMASGLITFACATTG
jgi:hypothetical protein